MATPNPPVPPTPPAPPPMRRWVRWLLIASLTLNFLVIGMVSGAAYKFRSDGPRAMELSLGPFARALGDADRRAIKRELMQNDSVRPPPRDVRQAAMIALVTALRAEPFTLDQVRTQLDYQRDWVMNVQEVAQEAVLARIGTMTPEERGAFADRLERGISDDYDFGEEGPP